MGGRRGEKDAGDRLVQGVPNIRYQAGFFPSLAAANYYPRRYPLFWVTRSCVNTVIFFAHFGGQRSPGMGKLLADRRGSAREFSAAITIDLRSQSVFSFFSFFSNFTVALETGFSLPQRVQDSRMAGLSKA